jgi:hypothetical protein
MYPPELPQKMRRGLIRPDLSCDPPSSFGLSEVAKAEGFEPSVPCGTLAFKILATPFRSVREVRYRWSHTGTDISRTAANGHE